MSPTSKNPNPQDQKKLHYFMSVLAHTSRQLKEPNQPIIALTGSHGVRWPRTRLDHLKAAAHRFVNLEGAVADSAVLEVGVSIEQLLKAERRNKT